MAKQMVQQRGAEKKGNAAVKAEHKAWQGRSSSASKEAHACTEGRKAAGARDTKLRRLPKRRQKKGRQNKGEVSQQAKTEMPELRCSAGCQREGCCHPHADASHEKGDNAGTATDSHARGVSCMDITGKHCQPRELKMCMQINKLCAIFRGMVYEAVLQMLTGKDMGDIQMGVGSCRAEEYLALSREHMHAAL